MVCLWGNAYINEFGFLSEPYLSDLRAGLTGSPALFFYVLSSRAVLTVMVLTALSGRRPRPAALLCACLPGFSGGCLAGACAVRLGIAGILFLALQFFPHGILYVHAWRELLPLWRGGKCHVRAAFRPAALFVVGAAAETWLHPLIMRVLLRVFRL